MSKEVSQPAVALMGETGAESRLVAYKEPK